MDLETNDESTTAFDAVQYAHQLVESDAVIVTPWVLVVAARTPSGVNLKSYVGIVKVGGVMFCSCNASGLETALTSTSLQLSGSVGKQVPCEHIAVLPCFNDFDSDIIDEWLTPADRAPGEHQYTSPDNDVVPLGNNTFLVYHNRGFATVSNGKCDCSNHNGRCRYQQVARETASSADEEWHVVIRKQQCAISQQKIPFIAKRITTLSSMEVKVETCPKCQSKDLTLESTTIPVPCFHRTTISEVAVRSAFCMKCKQTVYPDGGDIGLVNMSTFFISHEILADYCTLFVGEGLTLFGYFKSLQWNWSFLDEAPLSYDKLRLAWLSYVSLMDFGSLLEENFQCHLCGSQPDVIICDGITLSLQKRYVTNMGMTSSDSPILEGSRYASRIAVKSVALRKKLDAVDVEGAMAALTEDDMWLRPLLSFITKQPDTPPDTWKRLIKDLGCNTAVIGMFDLKSPGSMELLKRIAICGLKSAEDADLLAMVSPVFYAILREPVCDEAEECLQAVLTHLLEKIEYILRFPSRPREQYTGEQKGDGLSSLPKLYNRGSFQMDKSGADQKVCTKVAPKIKKLTPGVFTIHCPHGVCYGFELMKTCESVNIPFTIMRTRLQKAPSLIVYDNACILHAYCLNRDPAYFAHTKFCVDRFHWYNHKGCSSGYNIRNFPQYNHHNTQVAEQSNAILGRLRAMLSYCNEANFTSYLRLFLWFRNTIHLLKLREPKTIIERQLNRLVPYYTKSS